jgi:hypothetical protein
MRSLLLSIPLILLAAACSRENSPSGAGGVSAGEAKALDEAAEMIEARRLPDSALRPPAAQQTTAPEEK